ncbi:MAG: protein kinase domain-containing protein [Planctomycetaceae bacterium]
MTPDRVTVAGRDYSVREHRRVHRRDYWLLEQLSVEPRQRFLAFDPHAGPAGSLRRLLVLPDDEGSRQQLSVLQRMAQSSDHFAKVLDFEQQRDGWIVVLDWVAGIDLKTFLTEVRSGQRPRPGTVIAVQRMRGLAHALAKMHRKFRVVHGDLKPENLIVANDSGRFVLIDYGSAWTAERTRQRSDGDGSHPAYAAPERHLGRVADYRSDQFSLGVLLFELLTLRLPYADLGGKAGRPEFIEQAQAAWQPPSELSHERDAIPRLLWDGIDRVLRHCLSLTPDDRYATTADWLAAFDELCLDIQRPPQELSPLNDALTGVVSWFAKRFS